MCAETQFGVKQISATLFSSNRVKVDSAHFRYPHTRVSAKSRDVKDSTVNPRRDTCDLLDSVKRNIPMTAQYLTHTPLVIGVEEDTINPAAYPNSCKGSPLQKESRGRTPRLAYAWSV